MFSVLSLGPAHAGASSPGEPLADENGHVQVTIAVNGQTSGAPNQPSGEPSELSTGRPSTLADIAQAMEAASTAGQPGKKQPLIQSYDLWCHCAFFFLVISSQFDLKAYEPKRCTCTHTPLCLINSIKYLH